MIAKGQNYYLKMLTVLCVLAEIMVSLTGCKNSVTEKPSDISVTTITLFDAEDNTNNPVIEEPTMTPTSTPVPCTPSPLPSERKVSYKELMDKEILCNGFFGEEQEFETEFNKRKEYLQAFDVIDEEEIDIILTYASLLYIWDELDETVRNKYLLLHNDENGKAVVDILDKIVIYNFENPDNTIVISWLGEWSYQERIVMNSYQQTLYEARNFKTVDGLRFDRIPYLSSRRKTYIVHDKDKKGTAEIVYLDDAYDNSFKYFILAMSYGTIDRISKEKSSYDVNETRRYVQESLQKYQSVMEDLEWLHRPTYWFSGGYFWSPIYDDPNFPGYVGHSQ